MSDWPRTVSLALTGASGVQYGLRLLECLLRSGTRVYLMLSQPARVVIGMETDLQLPGRQSELARALGGLYGAAPGQLHVFGEQQWTAPVASGSGAAEAMVICPCTTGTLSAVAVGASRSLIERAADVALKERRTLIVVLRETPLSEIHLENMLRLTRMGAVMMPANPGFYHRPTRVEDLVDFMVARILDHLEIPQTLLPPWGEPDADA
ncbi:aromatic acid decarboxylase [Acidihalobacter aeolianus]|uniref:Flavin prenyltransferase UbiX n=1 Tax=Acidihalobacter aeolianus TaxID=2792603 RepID=A0A1D8K9Q2_9GAMM|nr:flavin prenyltransferase UbiX [Acidihalobacter aeolianus]AOV17693.1 aromatic acid decarboxylase [Acidihalobacter aeolianus]